MVRSKQISDFKNVVDWADMTNEQIPNVLDVRNFIISQNALNKPTYHISENTDLELITTSSLDSTLMTIMPESTGIYSISFNTKYMLDATDITEQAYIDLNLAYQDLMSFATTENMAAAIPSREFTPGVYSIPTAGTIAANIDITLNGAGTYIFKCGAAFSMGADVNIILTGGALASEVFWIAEGAIAIGANSNVSGNLISHNGAVDLGAGCSVKGRLLALTSGAISINNSVIENINPSTTVTWGAVSSFSIFTTGGVISNTSTSIIYGNIGTRTGGISTVTFESPTIFYGQYYTAVIHNSKATFSIYSNGIIIENSSRSRLSDSNNIDVALEGITELLEDGNTIDIKWNVDSGKITANERILTLIKLS